MPKADVHEHRAYGQVEAKVVDLEAEAEIRLLCGMLGDGQRTTVDPLCHG